MVTLIPPHGGTLVQRLLEDEQKISEIIAAPNLPRVEIPDTTLVEVENISFGCFSPLQGFPGEKEFISILSTWQLSNGTTFPIPPIFPIDEQTKKVIDGHPRLLLTHQHKPVAYMELEEIFPFDKDLFLQSVFGTTNITHPGVRHISSVGDYLVAGKVSLFKKQAKFFQENTLTPLTARELFSKQGWKTITAFSTTNIPHRAHEYLQRCALEMTDGLFIHALQIIGKEAKDAKYSPEVIASSYQQLVDKYYPARKVIFSFLPMLVRSAGPRSSVLQAIVRQNFGCSHQIFGRDHEGFANFYGKYESQQIFQRFSDLKITPLCLKEPFYCARCQQITTENSCGHEVRIEISGTEIRRRLAAGEMIEEFLLRAEVKEVLERN